MEQKSAWTYYDENQIRELEYIAKNYCKFLDNSKTERKCVKQILKEARANGYISLEEHRAQNKRLSSGDKVYIEKMNKSIALFHIGNHPLESGMNILGSHIDSPRLDVKQRPVYEDSNLVYLDTHYYGAIKKYQWVTLPLALHGIIVKKDGRSLEINIGEKDDDPVLCITDLLVHLAGDQMQKKGHELIEGENLDVIIGNRPIKNYVKENQSKPVKENILNLLKQTYDISESDFFSAELEIVPAGRARDCGFDKSMILAYGQDDRACVYATLAAMLSIEKNTRTNCCFFVDKEEIGSVGATGMLSVFFENAVAEILHEVESYSELRLRRVFCNSNMISADVNASYDPSFSEVFDKENSSYLGNGFVLSKFSGGGGKFGSNDANAEYIAKLRRIFDNHNIAFQTAELGKVDSGSGGTIAHLAARYGMNVIDGGIAVLNMHAPWEIISKADLYEAKKAFEVFLLDE